MTTAQTRDALREALDYLTPHPSTKGPVILDPAKMRAAVSALEAEVEGLKKTEVEFAEVARRSVALWQDKHEAAEAELRAVDLAFGGVADSERAERILHWIGEAADATTRASAAEAERDALALMLGDCITALSQVPLAYLPGAVEMMVSSALEAPIQGDLSREHLTKIALERFTEARALAQRVGEERDRAVADAARLNSFVAFVLKWCDRGPPHGGPGNEAVALDAIAHHPIVRNARQAAARSVIEPTEGENA